MNNRIARKPLSILTTFRFFAATEVVLFHSLYSKLPKNTVQYNLTASGDYAVTFFFLLSGFVLYYVYAGRHERDKITVSFNDFLRARVARVYPAYIIGLALALPCLVYGTLFSKIVPLSDFFAALILVPSMLQAWWPPSALAWNVSAWSLSVELFFYFLFPFLAIILGGLSRRYAILTAYGLVMLSNLARHLLSSGAASPSFIAYFPIFHLPTFIFGVVLGRIFLFGNAYSEWAHKIILTVGLLYVTIILIGRSWLPSIATNNVILVTAFALIIFGGARAENGFRFLTRPFLILLGDASYCIYILHVPLGWWWWLSTRGLTLSSQASFLIYFILLCIISILSFLYIEQPLRRKVLGH
jgi:peptidoglycan/LPS O-acetylase OafA/YrhL